VLAGLDADQPRLLNEALEHVVDHHAGHEDRRLVDSGGELHEGGLSVLSVVQYRRSVAELRPIKIARNYCQSRADAERARRAAGRRLTVHLLAS